MDAYFNGKVAVVTGAGGVICSQVAKDLASLMGGVFEIGIDGDLFKASVVLDEAVSARQILTAKSAPQTGSDMREMMAGAGHAASQAMSQAGQTVSQAAGTAGKAVGDAISDAGQAAGNLMKKLRRKSGQTAAPNKASEAAYEPAAEAYEPLQPIFTDVPDAEYEPVEE